ncbi:LytTR family DNA-binding domain-containing protein [Frigidibacter sp.]|uniref:LytTR family DNA-binding domain-containing protein n=1 Tax=Frigidibacter sp. TaxID=2586418 RepID=UPI0027372B0C|nr:LytTR family DNA-binding domain-containing protein [Frigidibacter sp.]MDP3338818.1 LytTR family DNA-binding domain-containing protein [Frigidibacter sp.]
MVLRLTTSLFKDWKRLFASWKRVVSAPAAVVTWFVLSIMTTLAGPFGSYEVFPIALRAIYWPVLLGLGVLIGSAVRVLVEERICTRRIWPGSFVISAINVVLFTPPLYAITLWLSGPGDTTPSHVEFGFFVFCGSLGVGAVRNVMADAQVELPLPPPPPQDALPRLIYRLPEERQAPLLRLSVRDHYVVIHTELGTDTLLMRFADAMAETDPVDGLQVHRSHWVAVSAVAEVLRRGGRTLLVMQDGVEVPVSRAFQASVAERWPG